MKGMPLAKKTSLIIVIPLVIILNIIIIIIGYFFFISGYIELAILIWILKGVADVFLIWFITRFLKYLADPDIVDPPCVIFLGVVLAIAIFLSTMNILINI